MLNGGGFLAANSAAFPVKKKVLKLKIQKSLVTTINKKHLTIQKLFTCLFILFNIVLSFLEFNLKIIK